MSSETPRIGRFFSLKNKTYKVKIDLAGFLFSMPNALRALTIKLIGSTWRHRKYRIYTFPSRLQHRLSS